MFRSRLALRWLSAKASTNSLESMAAHLSFSPRKSHTWSAAFVLASLLTAGPVHASKVVPDWVHDAASQSLPSFPSSTKAVVLLHEETYTVAPDGRATIHVKVVTKILRPQGREDAVAFVGYDKDSKIMSMHVWSIDPAGHEYAVKDNEMVDVGQPGVGGELYSDERARAAIPPGRDPGGVIAYEYEKRERPYVAEANWDFQDDLPHVAQSFTLMLPPGFHYTTTWAHHAKVEPTELPNSGLRWAMDREPAIDVDDIPLAPSPGALAARMTVHYSGPGLAMPQEGTWQGIGQWFAVLSRDRLVATPEITAKANELVAGKTDFYDKAEAMGEFVQKQIRYVEIKIGVGGWQPHYAQETFHGRYGDCKDKATLLSAMLSSVGIHSALVIVDTNRGFIDPDAPSILANHAIAAIELPAGYTNPKLRSVVTAKNGKRYLIFDPTWELTPFGQLENNLQGSYGMLMEGDASQILQLPVLSPDLNRMERNGTFTLSADGTLKGKVVEKSFGDVSEENRYFFKLDAQKQHNYLDRLMAQDFMAVSVSDMAVANVDSLNENITLSYGLAADHFAAATGPLLMVRPRVLGSEKIAIDRKTRHVAIDLGETKQAQDSFDIDIPDGYTVDELPDPVKLDLGFATYESATELHGHTLHYSRTFRVKEVTLPPERYPDLQKLASFIAADENNQAVLKRTK